MSPLYRSSSGNLGGAGGDGFHEDVAGNAEGRDEFEEDATRKRRDARRVKGTHTFSMTVVVARGAAVAVTVTVSLMVTCERGEEEEESVKSDDDAISNEKRDG